MRSVLKKLFLSAFAVSLTTLAGLTHAQIVGEGNFLGLESEIFPELKGEQSFTSTELHESAEWRVDPSKVIKDVETPPKGQGHSIIPWTDLDPDEWMNINTWMTERKLKDAIPDWKIRQRLADQKELVGKVLHCKGRCFVFRGTESANVSHLSQILEGDEFHTDFDSVAWIFTIDGSVVRLSPESSLTFQEVNIGQSEIFILARLNQGHIYWNSREQSEFVLDLAPETDTISLPLMVREANQAYFERKNFQAQDDEARLSEVLDLDENAMKDQVKRLNELRGGQALKLKSRVMMVAPNSSLISLQTSFDYYYLPGNKSYFKRRSFHEGSELSLHLRGYTETGTIPVDSDEWFEVDKTGRIYMRTETTGPLQIMELITKRIKTIELAREIWVREITLPITLASENGKVLSEKFGHQLWGDELQERYSFLVEYTRRIETSHLKSLDNLIIKLEEKNENIVKELDETPYRVSLNHYLLGLKNRYDNKKMQVREMNDLQYYVWILKNGKL